MDKRISLNQFAEYSTKKKESSKLRIIKQQKNPDPLRLPWYQLAKAKMKLSLKNHVDLVPIYQGIQILSGRTPEKRWQKIDRVSSIEALEKYIGLNFPEILKQNVEVLSPANTSISINNLIVSIGPELIFRVKDEFGKSRLGAVKIHCGKNSLFEQKTAQLASVLLFRFLQSIAEPSDLVEPRFCFIIDVFGKRIVAVPSSHKEYSIIVDDLCHEIVMNWDVA